MLSFSDAFSLAGAGVPIHLFTSPTDMRKSFDGLCGLVALHGMDVTVTDSLASGGGLFVFLNRRRDRMKVLYFDTDGLAIWYKRLERGCYELPPGSTNQTKRGDVIINASQLRCILDGIDLSSVKRRKRYIPSSRKNPQGVTDDEPTPDRTTAATRRDDYAASGDDCGVD